MVIPDSPRSRTLRVLHGGANHRDPSGILETLPFIGWSQACDNAVLTICYNFYAFFIAKISVVVWVVHTSTLQIDIL